MVNGGTAVADRYVDYVPLDQVKPASRNPKRHDSAGINRSINHHGLAELPLLDERTGRLVAGHGRHEQLTVMRDTGQQAPDGIRVDNTGAWHMPVIRGWSSRSDADADAYLIGSNEWTIRGGWDETGLAQVLSDLAKADLLDLTGYNTDDLDALLGTDDFDAGPTGLDESGRADWPLIRAQVPPDVYERWETIDGDDDAHRIRAVMHLAGI